MKISIISDSHDNTDNMKKAIDISNGRSCEYLFHLGDIVSPFSAKLLKNFNGIVKAVFGNNDGEILGLKRVFNTFCGEIEYPPYKFSLNDKRFVIMHEPYLIEELAKSGEFDYIFYGHLHKVDKRVVNNANILNPGELGGWVEVASFFILDTEKNEFTKINI